MTPVGHIAASYVIGRALPRRLAISVGGLVVGGVLPDVDFVMFWAPEFNAWHRVVTHNLLLCALAAALAGALGAWRGGASAALRWGSGVGLGALAHLVADSVMDANASNGIGVAWLWPWDPQPRSPFNLMSLLPVEGDGRGWAEPGRALRSALAGVIWELPLWIAAGWWWRRAESEPASVPPPPGAQGE